MTYEADDTSIHAGNPQEMFEFVGSEAVYRFTSHPRDLSFDSSAFSGQVGTNLYTAIPMIRSSIRLTANGTADELAVELPASGAASQLLGDYAFGEAPESLLLYVYRRHGDAGPAIQYWKGSVAGFSGKGALMTARSRSVLSDALVSTCGRLRWQGQCNHFLYDDFCQMNPNDFEVVTVVDAISANLLEVTLDDDGGSPDGWFDNGYAVANGQRRDIESHVGNVITLTERFRTLAVTDEIEVFPGCDHTLHGANGCDQKFANSINYGGVPFMLDRDIIRYGIFGGKR